MLGALKTLVFHFLEPSDVHVGLDLIGIVRCELPQVGQIYARDNKTATILAKCGKFDPDVNVPRLFVESVPMIT